MVPVKHAGDTVETETVDVIFLHPVLAVREKEVLCLILSIVEAARAPCRMPSLPAGIEIEVLLTIEHSKSLRLIVYRMRMNDIHHDRDSESVSIINKGLEFLRRTETRTQCIEVRHLVTERAVIRMLLKSHYLKSIITELSHLRKDIQSELLESTDLLLLRSHTDMALINKRMRSLARLLVLPYIRFHRIPHLSTETLGMRVLHSSGHICRQSFSSTAFPLDVKLEQGSMIKEHVREHYLPVSASYRLECIYITAFPVVELTDDIYLGSIRRPLAEHPVTLIITMQTIIHMIVHTLAQRAVHRHPLLGLKNHFMPAVDHILIRHQPFVIVIDHLFSFCAHIAIF